MNLFKRILKQLFIFIIMKISQVKSPGDVRKNYQQFKEQLKENPQYEDFLWNTFCRKFDINTTDKYFILLKKFINNEKILINCKDDFFIQKGENTIVLYDISKQNNFHINSLCDHLGLHYELKPCQTKYVTYVYKPQNWSWEFTEKNPYVNTCIPNPVKQPVPKKTKKNKNTIQKKNIIMQKCFICNKIDEDLNMKKSSVYSQKIFCKNCYDVVHTF